MSGYNHGYESSLLRGDSDPRPWDIAEVISDHLSGDSWLDIGCGTAFKVLHMAERVRRYVGLDVNDKMLKKALENVRDLGVTNVSFILGRNERLPFANESFDFVSSIVTQFVPSEIFRVLKPGGILVLETVDPRDRWDIKREFGEDNEGLRAQYANLYPGGKERFCRNEFGALFFEAEVRVGRWDAYYTIEALTLLLEQAPIVRDFNRIKDQAILERIRTKFSTTRGIKTTQVHILVVAKK